MVDIKRNIANYFGNTNLEKKHCKVVKSIERWVKDALKREKLTVFSMIGLRRLVKSVVFQEGKFLT